MAFEGAGAPEPGVNTGGDTADDAEVTVAGVGDDGVEVAVAGADAAVAADTVAVGVDAATIDAAAVLLRIAGIAAESIVDGPGFRLTVFTQGCPHACPGCHNPETHPPDGGYEISCGEILAMAKQNPLLRGLTFSGGEPFLQARALAGLAALAHAAGFDIVTYTGYTIEALWSGNDDGVVVAAGVGVGADAACTVIADIADSTVDVADAADRLALLRQTDILVDGPFFVSLRTLDVPFKGSSNQRILDVPASLAALTRGEPPALAVLPDA